MWSPRFDSDSTKSVTVDRPAYACKTYAQWELGLAAAKVYKTCIEGVRDQADKTQQNKLEFEGNGGIQVDTTLES